MKTNNANVLLVVGVAAVVIVTGFFALRPAPAPTTDAPSTDGQQNVAGQRAGLQEFNDGIKAGDMNTKWVARTLPVGSASVPLYTNTTGHDVYADFGAADVLTGQTSSSTFMVSLFATTSSSSAVPAWADFGTLAEGARALINAVALATSTTATSTNSVLAVAQAKGAGAVVVPNGATLFGYIQQTYATKCTGATCETASSTNRGFNPQFRVRLSTYGQTSF